MILKNILIYGENETFRAGGICVRNGVIEKIVYGDDWDTIQTDEGEEVKDGQGYYCIPGMIDLHFHGCKGYDVCDGTREAIREIARYEASIGVTAIAPATMTLPVEELEHILRTMAEYREEQLAGKEDDSADLVGINMEGPFISKEKKGAQNEAYIRPFDMGIYRRFQEAAKGLVKFIGIAPEVANGTEFIEEVKKEVTVALAHTNADYETAKKAFDAGAKHAVHLYNGMPTFTHREPGVVGAVVDSPWVSVELICDGVHIHPATVRATFSMMGKERMILISDSIRATGMPDGTYELGGLDVKVSGNRATLVSDGALAGSITSLPDCVRYAVKEMNVSLETAIACATSHPAKSLGIENEYGVIAEGRRGDLVLWDQDLNLIQVYKAGNELISNKSCLSYSQFL